MPKNNIRCYIYTRVSTAIQVDGYSLDAQKDKLRKYADYQNMEIAGEYSDEGASGKNIAERPEFMKMMNDIEDSKDGVLMSCVQIITIRKKCCRCFEFTSAYAGS